jgi:hypothetical protein
MPCNLPVNNKQDLKENSCVSLERVIYDKLPEMPQSSFGSFQFHFLVEQNYR